jgi:hypothetical protein
MSARTAVAPLLLLLAAAPAAADEIRLVNGRTLEGRAQRVGDEVVVRSSVGEVRLPAKEVASIVVGPTKDDLYRERAAKLDAKDIAQQVALADWCREQRLTEFEKRHLRAVIAIDPDHAEARARLGYVRHDGAWLTEDEYHRARGFVKVRGAWVSQDEVERKAAEKTTRAAMDAHLRTIRDAIGKMASPKRRTRADGRIGLQQYAERMGDPGLAQFASDVASYYNEAWRLVKTEWEGGTATVEVRATATNLKRPIPTIETSLGAFSTPVRIQLPEISVIAVRTTARVPITIELDE